MDQDGHRGVLSSEAGVASRRRVVALLLACFVACGVGLGAAERPREPRFEKVPGTDELPDPRISDIALDRTGFLWLATVFGGLVRYDGYGFRHFASDPADPGTLTDDHLRNLLVDREGMLWVGTFDVGLNRFDPRTERATRYRHDASDPRSLSSDQVRALLEDRRGRLWVGTMGGLNRLDDPAGGFVRFRHDPDDPSSLADDKVMALVEGPDGRLWIGTAAGGLHSFDEDSGAFVRYRHDPGDPASLGDDRIQALAADAAGRIWVGSWGGGLGVRDPASGRFTRYRHDPGDPSSLPGDELFNVWVDPEGLVWVISLDGGLARLDPETGRWERFLHRLDKAGSPSEGLAGAVHQDSSSGAVWLGTYGQGVDVWYPTKPRISHYRHVDGRTSGLSDDLVLGVLEGPDGAVWAATRRGLDRLDPATGTFTSYRHRPGDPHSLASDFVWGLLAGHDGTLWVGTWGAGLEGLDLGTGRFTHYPCGPGVPGGLVDCDVRELFEDSSGVLWVGTFGGLHRLDPHTRTFARYTHDPADPTSLSNSTVCSIAEDGDGTLWVGTKNGLNRWQPHSGTFERYEHDPHRPGGLAHPEVRAIHAERDGSLWLGSGAGLQRLRWDASGTPHFESFDDVLPRLSIAGILEDDSGQLWLTTRSSGLWRFDPKARQARGLGRGDGLPRGGTDWPSRRMKDGRLLLGGTDGLAILDPETVATNPHEPPVVITEVAVGDRPRTTDPGAPATLPLVLSYRDRIVSFEFAALDFQAPEQNRYRYRLEGFEPDWHETDARRRRATYTALEPGDYVFRVQGSNNHGVWNTEGASLRVTVTPAWWQTVWFRGSVIVAVAGLLLLTHGMRVRYIARANRRLQLEVEERRAVERNLVRSQEHLRRLSGELVQTQEEERRRVARELHDGINQKLAMLAVRIGLLARRPPGDGETASSLEEIKQSTIELSQEVRRVSHQLHSSELEHLGLVAALTQEAAELDGREGLAVVVEAQPIPETLSGDAALCLYRVAQESLRNAARHSGARRILVTLDAVDAGVELMVQDDGSGFDVETARARSGLGLTSMEERVRYLSGRFRLTSAPGGGTEVQAWVPIAPPESREASPRRPAPP